MKKLLLILIFITSGYPQINPYFDFFNIPENKNVQKLTIIASTDNYVIDDGGGSKYFQVAGVAGKTFTVDWDDGTTSEITFIGETTDQRIAKTYANAGVYNVRIYGWKYVTKLQWRGWNAGAFNLQDLPSGLTYLYLLDTGPNIKGSISNLPNGLTFLYLNYLGPNLTGSIDSLPPELTFLFLNYIGNLTGSIDNLSSKLTYLRLAYLYNSNIIGSISSLNNNISSINLINVGNNFDLTTNLKAFNSANIIITPQTGYGYTTAQIDSFLIAYDQVAGTGVKTIDLRGANEPRSTLSDAAVASLEAKGRTILVNGVIQGESGGLFTSDGGELYASDGARLIAQ